MLLGIVAMIRASTGLSYGQGRRGGAHLGGPLKFGNRAPRRVRSQAFAQKHQGPPNWVNCGPRPCCREGQTPAAVSTG